MLQKMLLICQENKIRFYQSLLKSFGANNLLIYTSEFTLWKAFEVMEIEEISCVNIQVELSWNNQKYFGIKLGERLRMKGLRCPFFF